MDPTKKPLPYLWLDDEDGRIKMMGEPCTILFSESLSALRVAIQRLVGTGAGAALRAIGKEMGMRHAQIILRQYPEIRDLHPETQIYELCSIILRNMGWGNIEILSLDLEGGVVEIRLRDHPTAIQWEDEEPICHLEAGLVSGILDETTDESFIASDFLCTCPGETCHATCRIKFRRERTY